MNTKTKTKMEMSSSQELTYSILLIFSLVAFSFPNLSSSQKNSPPQNIETHYPYWPPPPPPLLPPPPPPTPSRNPYNYTPPPPSPDLLQPPPPSEPPSSSPSKTIITAVGVTAASAFVAAALVFLLVSRLSKSRRKNEAGTSGGGSGGGPTLPVVTVNRSVTNTWTVDKDGLDHHYWEELNRSKNGSLGGSRIHPDPGGSDGGTSVSLHAVAGSLGEGTMEEPVDHSSGDIREAIFGTLATRKSPPEENTSSTIAGKVYILDPTKSQNIATVLRSLGIPRGKLINALLEGKGASADALEQLNSTALTSEEVSKIQAFNGDPTTLAYAESFLYVLLKAVPSAFARADKMLFWLNYDNGVLSLKESLQTLDSACDELRTRGIILKLLQAIHNTATRLCTGTLSEEAKAFKLNTLRKLSDYKSTDGGTTLLQFVVHQVVRNEGRRCVMARNSSMSRNSSISRQNSTPAPQDVDDMTAPKGEKEKEFLMLGLPIVGGLSSEFANVKKSANMDYDEVKGALDSLVNRVKEAGQLKLSDKSTVGSGGFEMEMRYLLESAEVETKAAQVEHTRVMLLVRKTAQYYQAGASNNDENPLQLFVIVNDFLSMIDQTCVEIARSLQQKQTTAGAGADSESESDGSSLKTRVNFPRLPEHFFSDTSTTS